ncbi:hypothetical protein BGW80DRAFT_1345086 [Lactifluus volemus]|nr:hypothetical protein BGW80DRAFT_1345086 [Lactifluus volemus]
MSWPAVLTFLLLLSGFAFERNQVRGMFPSCSSDPNVWSSSLTNSLGQDICTVGVKMLEECASVLGATYLATPVEVGCAERNTPPPGPDSCVCNAVSYMLVTGCRICQGCSDFSTWTDWTKNCNISSFPVAVGFRTAIPNWVNCINPSTIPPNDVNYFKQMVGVLGDYPETTSGTVPSGCDVAGQVGMAGGAHNITSLSL